ncbi:hypothetical protein [Sphingomonas kyeonggiensis]|uniref:Uncharacterized protein n=1 Tax=Sphingomonas kyeonggiensis TaxID=1268553 RepID=A0A7W6JRY5_9SPHN|nr:hypothetical protein [Sphingomonas kyeonggiensis]MBB4098370.1 hypothetical protein [Sphingomonas kyeonggiensis]
MAQPDYRAQAARCRAEADLATLENVRDRCLRAEAAWIDMAVRQEHVADARARRESSPAN